MTKSLEADNEHVLAADERLVVPPYDMSAEQSVLGVWLIDNKQHENYLRFPVEPEMFYFDEHVKIAKVVKDYVLLGKGTDPILVAAELKSKNELDVAGGLFLQRIEESV